MSTFFRMNLYRFVLLLGVTAMAGCESVAYLAQAVHGQGRLLLNGKPIIKILQQAKTPQPLRRQLTAVQSILDFAEQELALPSGGSYRNYVELNQSAVVYNVFATPALSLQPRQWCFPVVGCVLYRGYFAAADAREYASKLRQDGTDVFIGGAAAYSTLGWFDDPLLSTMLNRSTADLAALLFHELTHRRLYIKGQTQFNESLATLVEHEGLRRWLLAHQQISRLAQYQKLWQRKTAVLQLIADYRIKLATLYVGMNSDASKRDKKKQLFADLKMAYQKRFGQQSTGLGWWFSGALNNAALLPVTAYNKLVPEFSQLLTKHKGDFIAFFNTLDRIAATGDPLTALHHQNTSSSGQVFSLYQ